MTVRSTKTSKHFMSTWEINNFPKNLWKLRSTAHAVTLHLISTALVRLQNRRTLRKTQRKKLDVPIISTKESVSI